MYLSLCNKSKDKIMRLSNKVLEILKGNRTLRLKLGLALGIGEQGVQQNIKRNSSNLTKIAAIRVICEETGYTEDQVLAKEKKTA